LCFSFYQIASRTHPWQVLWLVWYSRPLGFLLLYFY